MSQGAAFGEALKVFDLLFKRNFELPFVSILFTLFGIKVLQSEDRLDMSSPALLLGLAAIATAFAVWNRRPWWWAAYGALAVSYVGFATVAELREEEWLFGSLPILLLLGSLALAVGFYLRSAIARGRAEREIDTAATAGR